MYPFIASYMLARKWGARLIVDDPSLLGAFVGEKLKNWPLSGRLLRKVVEAFETLLYKRADCVICSSRRMIGRMRERLGGSTVVCHLSNGVDLEEFTVSPNGGPGNRIFFNCSFPYYQNLAALRNLLRIVDYFDQHAFGNYSVLIIVNDATLVPADVMALIQPNPRVTLLSNQPSLVPWLHQCDLVLLPYEKGHFTTAGPRLKVFEALACAKVVLSTKEGIDGASGCVDGRNLIVCSDWQDMAAKTIDLISKASRHDIKNMGREARYLIESHYSWKRLVKVYEQISAGDSSLVVGGCDRHAEADVRFAT
jgi:glycosyltransferase involved in cell wall biosynthesis